MLFTKTGEIHSLAWIPPSTNTAGLVELPVPDTILITFISLFSYDCPTIDANVRSAHRYKIVSTGQHKKNDNHRVQVRFEPTNNMVGKSLTCAGITLHRRLNSFVLSMVKNFANDFTSYSVLVSILKLSRKLVI